jgi:hypothetical protein
MRIGRVFFLRGPQTNFTGVPSQGRIPGSTADCAAPGHLSAKSGPSILTGPWGGRHQPRREVHRAAALGDAARPPASLFPSLDVFWRLDFVIGSRRRRKPEACKKVAGGRQGQRGRPPGSQQNSPVHPGRVIEKRAPRCSGRLDLRPPPRSLRSCTERGYNRYFGSCSKELSG